MLCTVFVGYAIVIFTALEVLSCRDNYVLLMRYREFTSSSRPKSFHFCGVSTVAEWSVVG